MIITFDQFKKACRFNAANGFKGSDGGTYFPDGPKCHHDELKKACFIARCPLLKPVKPAQVVQVVKTTAVRLLYQDKRIAYIKSQAGRIKAAPMLTLPALWLELAKEMKGSGLYSKTTYLQDIAHGIQKKAERMGLRG